LADTIQEIFPADLFHVPEHATSTVYVEGIPSNATEREVAHIFRPFTGFKSVRLIPRDKVVPGLLPGDGLSSD
jgi:hypothetical protein